MSFRPRGRQVLNLGLGLAISAGLIWWTFRRTDWDASWQYIVDVHRGWMLLAIVVATLPFPLRIPRWRILLRHEDGRPVGLAALWHAIAMGFAANNVLPLRAGEVVRTAAVSRLGHVPFATALSSVAVERVLDVLVGAGLLSLGLAWGGIDPARTLTEGGRPLSQMATFVGSLGMAALVVASLAAWRGEFTLRVARRLLPRGGVGDAAYRFAERILGGLGALRSPRTAVSVVGWSLAIWLCNGAGFYTAFAAFGFPISFAGALVLQGALMIGIAIPSSPGYFGVFEAATAGTLAALYDIPFAAGFAYGLLFHVTTFVPITFLGAWSAVRTGFRGDAIPEEQR